MSIDASYGGKQMKEKNGFLLPNRNRQYYTTLSPSENLHLQFWLGLCGQKSPLALGLPPQVERGSPEIGPDHAISSQILPPARYDICHRRFPGLPRNSSA